MFDKKISIDTDTEKYCNILVRYWYWLSIFLHSVSISILQYISDTDTCYFFSVSAKSLLSYILFLFFVILSYGNNFILNVNRNLIMNIFLFKSDFISNRAKVFWKLHWTQQFFEQYFVKSEWYITYSTLFLRNKIHVSM